MAFKIFARMEGYRVLGVKSGTNKAGNPYRLVTVFKDGSTCDVSSSSPEVVPAVDRLQEMQLVSFDVVAVSGKEKDYVIMTSAPVIVGE